MKDVEPTTTRKKPLNPSTIDRCVEFILDAEIGLDADLRAAEAARDGVTLDSLVARDQALAALFWSNTATLREIAAIARLDEGRVWLICNAAAAGALSPPASADLVAKQSR